MQARIRHLGVITLFFLGSATYASEEIDRNITIDELSTAQVETLQWLYQELGDDHQLVKVAYCESSLNHFESDGRTVKRGRENTLDTGLFQINLHYHAGDAEARGWDVHVRADNLAYTLHLVSSQGYQPWTATEYCWSDLRLPAPEEVS